MFNTTSFDVFNDTFFDDATGYDWMLHVWFNLLVDGAWRLGVSMEDFTGESHTKYFDGGYYNPWSDNFSHAIDSCVSEAIEQFTAEALDCFMEENGYKKLTKSRKDEFEALIDSCEGGNTYERISVWQSFLQWNDYTLVDAA